jgi:hypothetical protein
MASMPGPFPGMDPYVEASWGGVHVFLMGAIAARLNRSLPTGLRAMPEESDRVELAGGKPAPYVYRADVAVFPNPRPGPAGGAATAITVDPVLIPYERETVVDRNVQIIDIESGGRVVTVVEVLSPRNKRRGESNDAYRRKLADLDAGGVNWVEVDLPRSSRRWLPIRWDQLPPDRRTPYLALTHRHGDRVVRAYPIGLRQRLPTIDVPLRDGEPDAPLDLQPVFDRVYDDGSFAATDYSRPPTPPLGAADAAWAAELLASRR